MSGFCGMDPDRVRELGTLLAKEGQRIDDALAQVERIRAGARWEGADAREFESAWRALQHRARTVHGHLDGYGKDLARQAGDQDRTSSVDGHGGGEHSGGPGGSAVDGARRASEHAGAGHGGEISDARGHHDGGGAWDWLKKKAGDAGNAVKDGVSHVVDGAQRTASALADSGTAAARMAEDLLRHNRLPRFTELVAGGLHGGLLAVDALGRSMGQEWHLGQDGQGYADSPTRVDADGDDARSPRPTDLSTIQQTLANNYDQSVTMQVIGPKDHPTGVIVNVPGTQTWDPRAGDNPFDATGNLAQAGPGHRSAGSQAVADAMAKLYAEQGIPPGTPVMLNGHSQGGMTAASLASDPEFRAKYNVTNMMTTGSPVDSYGVDPSIRQINLQHQHDAVPRLDLGDAYAGPSPFPRVPVVPVPNPLPQNEGAHNVTLPDPPPSPDTNALVNNHDAGNYKNSIAVAQHDPGSDVSAYANDPSMQSFYAKDGTPVQTYKAGVHRKH